MGRRQNPVVAEFYERGDKLSDSSNRYEHTCRRCGLLFPKGRLEVLILHSCRECQYMTERDREFIRRESNVSTTIRNALNSRPHLRAVRPSANLERQPSALETLAEVSRRHMDYSAQRGQYEQNPLLQDETALAEQALWTQLQQHNMSSEQTQFQQYAMLSDQTELQQQDTSTSEAQSREHHLSNEDAQLQQHSIVDDQTRQQRNTHDNQAQYQQNRVMNDQTQLQQHNLSNDLVHSEQHSILNDQVQSQHYHTPNEHTPSHQHEQTQFQQHNISHERNEENAQSGEKAFTTTDCSQGLSTTHNNSDPSDSQELSDITMSLHSRDNIDTTMSEPRTVHNQEDSSTSYGRGSSFRPTIMIPGLTTPYDNRLDGTVIHNLMSRLDPQLSSEMLYSPTERTTTVSQTTTRTGNDALDAQSTATTPQFEFQTSGVPPRAGKPKPRGRFTDDRRKQVQSIRKQGACMRCRMLKKPCSEGTPCTTCASIDTARLWKRKCIRTRLVDEFVAWNVGYFEAAGQVQLAAMVPLGGTISTNVKVLLKLGCDDSQGLYIDAKRISQMLGASDMLDPGLSSMRHTGTMFTFGDEKEIISPLVEYCTSGTLLRRAIQAEPSSFVKTTLEQAQELVLVESLPDMSSDVMKITRNAYSVVTTLTRDTLELWLLTVCLTSSSSAYEFDISSATSEISTPNIDLLRAQLLSAIESRAAKLSKKVMLDLERRLLQRLQVSGFATIIVAVLLLVSIEHMTTFFHLQDTSGSENIKPIGWPLDMLPHKIWTQGSSFADLLVLLLDLRGLPPGTYEDEHGKLAATASHGNKYFKTNGATTEIQLRALDDERRNLLGAWLKRCDINASEVRSWANRPDTFNGKFVAEILLNSDAVKGSTD